MIEQLASHIFHDIRDKLSKFDQGDELSSSKIQAILEAQLRKMNLVTREEFDAQQAVLQKTREKLHEIEQNLITIEQQMSSDS